MDLFKMIHRYTLNWNNITIKFEYSDQSSGQLKLDVHVQVYDMNIIIFVK